jgi:hypothetical protein
LIDFDPSSLPHAHGRAGEVAKAVNGDTGGFLESGNEKRRGEMGQMMFDVVDLRAQ